MSYDVNQELGDHDVTVLSHDIIEPEPGKLKLAFVVQFADGERGNKDFYPLSSEKSLQMTRKVLRAMGFDMDNRDLGELQKNKELLKGSKVRAVVEENEYNGKVTNRIAYLNSIPKAATGSMLADLQKKLRDVKKSNRQEDL
jgi:hypothetical protein